MSQDPPWLPNITSKRLNTDDEDYNILSKMFKNQEGLIYAKKINNGLYLSEASKSTLCTGIHSNKLKWAF